MDSAIQTMVQAASGNGAATGTGPGGPGAGPSDPGAAGLGQSGGPSTIGIPGIPGFTGGAAGNVGGSFMPAFLARRAVGRGGGSLSAVGSGSAGAGGGTAVMPAGHALPAVTDVPEPPAVAMFAVAAMALVLLRRLRPPSRA